MNSFFHPFHFALDVDIPADRRDKDSKYAKVAGYFGVVPLHVCLSCINYKLWSIQNDPHIVKY